MASTAPHSTASARPHVAAAGPSRRGARVRTAARPAGPVVLALVAYLAYAAYQVWPALENLGTVIYGAPGDYTGAIAYLRELVEGGINPFAPGTIDDWNAPEGLPVNWRVNLTGVTSMSLLYVLALAFGPVTAFTLFTLTGYAASAFAMFLLARRVSGHAGASFVAGWAFAFFPYLANKGAGHPHFVHGWVLVVLVWRMLELHERPTIRNGLWAGGAAILAMSWTGYHILIAGVLFATLLAVVAVAALARRDLRRRLAPLVIAAVLAAGYVGGLAAVTLVGAGEGEGLRSHDIAALYTYSSRLHEFLVPPGGTMLLGDRTRPWLEERIHGSNGSESTLYLGVTVLAAALAGLIAALVRRRRDRRGAFVAAAALAVGATAVYFSAPPKIDIGPLTVPTPSEFIFDLTSTWRVYARFVIVVMLAACLLAALGLARLAQRGGRAGAALLVAAAAAVFVDLHFKPFDGAGTALSAPPAIQALERLPPGMVAHYPLLPEGVGDYNDLFLQGYHDKRVLNGYGGTEQEARALRLADFDDPRTPGRLASLGFRYALVPPGELDRPVRRAHARPVARGGYGGGEATIYELTAPPLALVAGVDGFGDVEQDGERDAQWMTAREGRVELWYRCRCRGTVRASLTSLVRQRVVVSDPRGRALARATVLPGQQVPVAVPVSVRGHAALVVRADPGPQQIPGPDPRAVSVRVTGLRFRPDATNPGRRRSGR